MYFIIQNKNSSLMHLQEVYPLKYCAAFVNQNVTKKNQHQYERHIFFKQGSIEMHTES